MNCICLLSLLLSSAQSLAQSIDIRFQQNDRLVRAVPLGDLGKLSPAKVLTVWDPNEGKKITYRGYPLTDVLNKVFGAEWKDSEHVLFVCADGFKSSVPRSIVEAQESLLAFERVGSGFSLNNRYQAEKSVKLAPLYLVWNNLKNEELRKEGSASWPYQIVGIEVVKMSAKFSRMTPPLGSSKRVQNGFLSYQKHCMACHRINGDGGEKGPELNSPVSVIERKKGTEWLEKWIDDPASVRTTTMPALDKSLPNRKKVISEIIAYLKEMSQHKVK